MSEPTRSLPARPTLEHLRKEAKDLLLAKATAPRSSDFTRFDEAHSTFERRHDGDLTCSPTAPA